MAEIFELAGDDVAAEFFVVNDQDMAGLQGPARRWKPIPC
jgi:hypothetical protein